MGTESSSSSAENNVVGRQAIGVSLLLAALFLLLNFCGDGPHSIELNYYKYTAVSLIGCSMLIVVARVWLNFPAYCAFVDNKRRNVGPLRWILSFIILISGGVLAIALEYNTFDVDIYNAYKFKHYSNILKFFVAANGFAFFVALLFCEIMIRFRNNPPMSSN